jgi:hypothetical protein
VSAAPPVHRVPGMVPRLRPFRAEEGPAFAPEAGPGCAVSAKRKGACLAFRLCTDPRKGGARAGYSCAIWIFGGGGGVSAAPPVHRVPGMAPGLRPFRAEEGPASAPEPAQGCAISAEKEGGLLPKSSLVGNLDRGIRHFPVTPERFTRPGLEWDTWGPNKPRIYF